jgi:uroporphyrinogen-III synthase
MKRVLITRTAEDACECVNLFSALELTSFVLPMIETAPLAPLFKWSRYDYCVLTSPASVRYFEPCRANLSIKTYAAIGEVTASLLTTRYGVAEILIPKQAHSLGIEELFASIPLEGTKILLPGALKRAGELEKFFAEKGADIDAPALYETKAIKYELNRVSNFLYNNRIEAVAFFSPSAVAAFMQQAELNGAAGVCIGETTAESLKRFGIKPFVSPKPTAAALAEFIKTL